MASKAPLWMLMVVCCMSLLLALVVAEAFIRVAMPSLQQHRDTELVFFKYDRLLGWTNKPLADGTFHIPASTTQVHISAQGLRDDDPAPVPEDDVKRIIVLGDSQTWGYGVEAADRYTKQLEHRFANAEVINMGVSGYGTAQEYLLLRTQGMAYNPDVVVVGFYNNDLMDNVETNNGNEFAYPRPVIVRRDDVLTVANVPVPYHDAQWRRTPTYYQAYGQPVRWLLQHSRLFYFVAKQFGPALHGFQVRMGWVDEVSRNVVDPQSENWKTTLATLTHMQRWLDGQHVTLVVAVIPVRRHVEIGTDVIEERLNVWATENDVPLVTMQDAFGKGDLDELYLKYDSHMSAQGHQLAGDLIADKLASLNLSFHS